MFMHVWIILAQANNVHCIGSNIPLNATIELLDILLKLSTPDMVRLT